MNISLSMVQMGAWVSIERVVSPPRRVCETDLDNSIVKSAMGVCEPDSANPASERGIAAATQKMADAPREQEQGQVCETNPGPIRVYL